MFVKNKIDNFKMLEKLDVNRVFSRVCHTIDESKVFLNIMKEKGFKYVGLRRATQAIGGVGQFINKLSIEDALYHISSFNFQLPAIIYESMGGYEDYILMQGEIQLFPDGTMWGRISEVPGFTMRQVLADPLKIQHFGTHPYSGDVRREVTWDYYKTQTVVDYICEKHIIGPVVEFTHYTIPVGIHRQRLLIWEIRNY